MIRRPAKVDSWKAKSSPSEARKCGRSNPEIDMHGYAIGRLAAGKIAGWILLFLLLLNPAQAEDELVYQVFAKAIAPLAACAFGGIEGQPGSMVAECSVEEAAGRLAAAQGMKLRLALEGPDHLRADLAYNGTLLSVCRDDQQLWAAPAEAMRALAEAAGLDVENDGPDQTPTPLLPATLDPQMLVFLPMVFQVKDMGMENIEGSPHRLLQLQLLPELAKTMRMEDLEAQVWIGPDYQPRRVLIRSRDYSLKLGIEKINFTDRLSPSAWQPSQGKKVLLLPASALNTLLQKMLGQKVGEF